MKKNVRRPYGVTERKWVFESLGSNTTASLLLWGCIIL
jgi:hypothetical protein